MMYFAGPIFIPMIALLAIGLMILILVFSVLFTLIFRIVKHRFPSKNFFISIFVILLVLIGAAYIDERNTTKAKNDFYGRSY